MALAAYRYGESYIAPVAGVALLRGWLRGSWGLLFSHPDDFASYGFEADRWLLHVQDAFVSAAARPIAVVSCEKEVPQTWVAVIGGAALAVRSVDRQRLSPRLQESERALFNAIVSATTRFVMIVDESLRLRRTLAYSLADRLPSPIELARMATRLRGATDGCAMGAAQCVGREPALEERTRRRLKLV